LSTLVAWNIAPSATFFNQALALAGWGALVWALALQPAGWLQPGAVPWAGVAPALGALELVGLGALMPWGAGAQAFSLVAAAVGLCAAAAVMLRAGQVAGAGPLAVPLARAFFGAWVLVGVLQAAVALVQVFAPEWADGDVIAQSGVVGRAVGNLRQPNHLSSLMLWACIALVGWLELRRDAGPAAPQAPARGPQQAEDGAGREGAPVPAQGIRAARALLTAWGALAAFGMALFIWTVVLTASRTGLVGVALLALWGLADRRLSRPARVLLLATPVLYAVAWWGMAWWAQASDHTFGGQQRLAEGDMSGSRFRIWADALYLIAQQPWTGVGWGNFNFAWSLTPFPGRHTAFFDHTHNLPLQLAVELGVPWALAVCALLLWALWQAARRALAATGAASTAGRCAGMMVLMMGLHSLLEYPLWYAYFLLPTALAWGLALGLPPAAPVAAGVTAEATAGADARPLLQSASPARGARAVAGPAPVPEPVSVAVPFSGPVMVPWGRAAAGVLCVAAALFAVFEYLRVAEIFSTRSGAAPLGQRIDVGKRSVFFGHHAHYAAAASSDSPWQEMPAFDIATHHLLDTQLMLAWTLAFAELGDLERARHLAQRLREFRNPLSARFLAECERPRPPDATAPPAPLPFQCAPPASALNWQDFLRPH
jgi:O-antigen ligase